MDPEFMAFLGDAADAPLLRIAGVIGLLDEMASDFAFDEVDRKHVDREKTALFWRIIGQELPSDAKTDSGTGWPAGFIASLPRQASRILDDCHLWTYVKAWSQTNVFLSRGAARDEVEHIFSTLRDAVQEPVYVEGLRQKFHHSEPGADTVQQLIYTLFIKLGILERAAWAKEPCLIEAQLLETMEQQQDTQPVETWAHRVLEDPISRTRACIKELCENLALQTVGGLDDTSRAQIRAVRNAICLSIWSSRAMRR